MDLEKIFAESNADTSRSDVAVFWQLVKPHTNRLITAVLCSLVLSGINGAIAWFIKPVLDSIFINKSLSFLVFLPFGIVFLFLARGLFTYLTNYLMNSIGAKLVKSLREDIYNKLLFLPQSFYGKTASGSIVSKVFNDIEILQLTVANTIKDFFVSGGTVIILAAVALLRRWDLALLSFIVIPLIAYSIAKLGIRMRSTSKTTRQLISKVTVFLHESLQGMKIIKAFTMEEKMGSRYEKALSDHYRNVMREIRIKELSVLLAEVLGGVGVAIIIYYGGNLVISEKISPGALFSFIAALLMIYTPLKRLSRVNNNFQQGRTIIERIKDIIMVEPEPRAGIEKDVQGNIVFEDVSFRYPSSKDYAIRNLNFKIRQGELIAIVGHSGAGKSTLVDLVAGFWYPGEGNLLIDDINIKDLSLQSLRRNIGLVTQDVILFNDTIRENILLGQPNATDGEIIEAAKAAYAHEFITAMPKGYETVIGERGTKLSGGQKQRLTIARAILKNPNILIFDEATSSLDTDSETKIQKAIENIIPGRTTIIIAHRLSTIRKADRIAVIDRGRIIQSGRHDELLEQDGIYRELYHMQFGLKGSNT
jgi:subfamily B ATP-binding cassette protein MsbA